MVPAQPFVVASRPSPTSSPRLGLREPLPLLLLSRAEENASRSRPPSRGVGGDLKRETGMGGRRAVRGLVVEATGREKGFRHRSGYLVRDESLVVEPKSLGLDESKPRSKTGTKRPDLHAIHRLEHLGSSLILHVGARLSLPVNVMHTVHYFHRYRLTRPFFSLFLGAETFLFLPLTDTRCPRFTRSTSSRYRISAPEQDGVLVPGHQGGEPLAPQKHHTGSTS